MLLYDSCHRLIGILFCPIALPLEHDLLPGDGHCSSLDHTLDGKIMCLFRCAAARIRDNVDLVSFFQRLKSWHYDTYFGPETRNQKFLAPTAGDRFLDSFI